MTDKAIANLIKKIDKEPEELLNYVHEVFEALKEVVGRVNLSKKQILVEIEKGDTKKPDFFFKSSPHCADEICRSICIGLGKALEIINKCNV